MLGPKFDNLTMFLNVFRDIKFMFVLMELRAIYISIKTSICFMKPGLKKRLVRTKLSCFLSWGVVRLWPRGPATNSLCILFQK